MLIYSIQKLPDWLIQGTLILLSAYIGKLIRKISDHLPRSILDYSELNLLATRSFGPKGQKKINWQDHMPFFNYFTLKNKAHTSPKKTSNSYPIIELITILLSLTVYQIMGPHNQMIAGLLLSWWLFTLLLIDIKYFLLPDILTLSLLFFGLLINLHGLFTPLENAVIGSIGGYCLFWLIDTLYFLLRKKNGLGQGDWKLFSALGAWFGYGAILYILILALLLATAASIFGLATKKLKWESALPFGPFLCVSAWIFLFFPNYFMGILPPYLTFTLPL